MAAPTINGVLKRTIYVHGVDSPILLYITSTGLEMAIPKTKKRVFISFDELVTHMSTGKDVPSFLYLQPNKLLQHYAMQQKLKEDKNAL